MVESPAPSARNGRGPAPGATTARPLVIEALRRSIMPAALLGGTATAAVVSRADNGSEQSRDRHGAGCHADCGRSTGRVRAGVTTAARQAADQIQLAVFGSILFISAVALPGTLPLVALALAFLSGVAQPLRAAAIQRLAADRVRARAASAASACDMAVRTDDGVVRGSLAEPPARVNLARAGNPTLVTASDLRRRRCRLDCFLGDTELALGAIGFFDVDGVLFQREGDRHTDGRVDPVRIGRGVFFQFEAQTIGFDDCTCGPPQSRVPGNQRAERG